MATEKEKAEFRGLFLGEGYVGICKYKAKYKHFHKAKNVLIVKNRIWYRPQMSLSQREDNAIMIHWVKEKFGGHVYISRNNRTDGKKTRRSIQWVTTNHDLCEKLCNMLLESLIPSKKLNSCKIVLEYLKKKYKKNEKRSQGYSEKQNKEFEELYFACKKNHEYQGK